MSTQIELLPEDVCADHHGNNKESREAFDNLLPRLSLLQERVLEYAIVRAEKGDRVTVKSVRYDLNLQHQTASARLTELKKMELIAPTEKRHENCRVLEVTDLGRRTLQAWQRRT
jgi:predicted transcriptional regulator